MGRADTHAADRRWDDLVDRLVVHEIGYLTGGSAWDGRESPYRSPADALAVELVVDLARAPQGRMHQALVALLFRHPEHAPVARAAAARLPNGDAIRLRIEASILAAAALREWWRFVLGIYLPGQPPIQADDLAAALGVPPPTDDYGRPCIAATAELLRSGESFPYNHERSWHDAAQHVLEELRAAARRRSA